MNDPVRNETDRVSAFRAFADLRTARNPAFDHISTIAREHFRVPMAFVSMVEEVELWFAGRQGIEGTCMNRKDAFCDQTVLSDDILVVEDARRDVRFRDKPPVTGEPFIRFYAGAPLILADGIRLGSVCIADRVPRTLNTGQRIVLRNLADIAVSELKLLQLRQAA